MPRTKGSKNKNGNGSRFKTYEGRYPADKHIRLTKDMMNDSEYKKLSPYAKVLYSYMKLWACGSEEVTFSYSMAKDFMARNTFYRAKDELIESGFLASLNSHLNKRDAQAKNEAGKYKFSPRWSISSMLE